MNGVLNIKKIVCFRAFVFDLNAQHQFLFNAEFHDGTIGIVRFPTSPQLRTASDCFKIIQVMGEVAKAKKLVDWDDIYRGYGVSRIEFLHVT